MWHTSIIHKRKLIAQNSCKFPEKQNRVKEILMWWLSANTTNQTFTTILTQFFGMTLRASFAFDWTVHSYWRLNVKPIKLPGSHTHTQANIFALFSPSAIHLFFNIVSAHNVNTTLCGNKNEIFFFFLSRLCVTSVALTGCTWKHICEKRSIVAVVVDAHDAHQPKFIGNFVIEIDVLGHTFTRLHYFADMYSVTV